ncbi:MAG: sensor histidine kinase [Xanthobacteraceae bacterium]
MGVRMRATDWSQTPLGAADSWPQSLRTTASLCLECRTAVFLAWGPELVILCNDECAAILGDQHPAALREAGRGAWPDLWAVVGPMLEGVMQNGQATQSRDLLLMTSRNGFSEETYFSFACSPVRDESGGVGGVFTSVTETTKKVVCERRLRALAELGGVTAETEDEAIRACLTLLQAHAADVPVALLYRLDGKDQRAVLQGTAKVDRGAPADIVELGSGTWHFADLAQGRSKLVRDLPAPIAETLRSPWNDPIHAALLAPILAGAEQEIHAAIVLGVSPRQKLDAEYEDFLKLVAGHVGAAVAKARLAEQQRACGMPLAGIEREETRTLEILHRIGAALADNLDLERIVQTVTDAATSLAGAQFGTFFYNVVDDKGEADTLYTVSGLAGESFSKLPMPCSTALFDPTFRSHGVIRSPDIRQDPRYGKNASHLGMPHGPLPVASYLAIPVVSRSGEVLGGLFFGHEQPGMFTGRVERLVAGIAAQAAIAIDNANLFRAAQTELAERRRVEQHQELLLAELNHRVKNTLAIVLSIATQTLRHADSAEIFRAGFEARIMALAEAHNLLTDGNWEGASLRAILERVLGPYRAEGRQRFHIETENDVRLGPQTAVAMVMAYSELATNAAKYGALSGDYGSVNVAWSVNRGEKPPRLRIKWEETGGPRVNEPCRSGFGSRLIRGLSHDASGKVDMKFLETGLVCMFDLPLTTGDRA